MRLCLYYLIFKKVGHIFHWNLQMEVFMRRPRPIAAYPDTVCFGTGSVDCAVHASETVLIPGDQGMKEKQRIRKGINRTCYAGIAEKLEE